MFSKVIPEEYLSIISDYFKILVPSLITYLVTRYSLSRPRKYEIRSKQFDFVYLPLYLLSKQLISDRFSNENLSMFIRKANKIIYKNYPFVYPKTIKLFNKMKDSTDNGKKNTYYVTTFIYQIESDYEKLKRELGYPTNSFVDFFKRLNKIDKIFYFFSLLLLVLGIYCVVISIHSFLSFDIIDFLFSLVCSIPSFFLSYLLYNSQH